MCLDREATPRLMWTVEMAYAVLASELDDFDLLFAALQFLTAHAGDIRARLPADKAVHVLLLVEART